jgi:hypothetical protein
MHPISSTPPSPHHAAILDVLLYTSPPRAPSVAPAEPRPFHAARRTAPPERQRGEGCAASSIRKDSSATSYGCPAGSGRDDAAEGREKRCNARSTFETSKYNSCNIHLKTVETCLWNTWKTHLKHTWKPLQLYANIRIKHMQHMCRTYATSR